MPRSAAPATAGVVWDSLRSFDSHAVRRKGVAFSTDKLNLTGLHTFSASGLSQSKALGIARDAKTGKLIATSKAKNGKLVKTGLGSGKVGVKAVQTITVGNNGYRADLQAAALARFQKLTRVTPKAVKA